MQEDFYVLMSNHNHEFFTHFTVLGDGPRWSSRPDYVKRFATLQEAQAEIDSNPAFHQRLKTEVVLAQVHHCPKYPNGTLAIASVD